MDFFLIYTSKNDRKTYIDASAYPAHPNKHTKASHHRRCNLQASIEQQ
jgi:hypothetical protein